ncbi:MAG: diacylglycerol kinase family lipid kinase [Polyangiaceae bacterium]|nr:diacylglycerol kinase family lipid kinase [Polyangiaceae bacterium]
MASGLLSVIINPISGRGSARKLPERFERLAREVGMTVDMRLTQREGHAKELAESARQKAAVVACAGGDGTINEVVNGLGAGGPPLLLVPTGTGNALAREVGAHADPVRYAASLRERRTVTRDLGRLHDGRLFAGLVGAGFEAECVRVYKEVRTGSIGRFQYVKLMGGFMWRAIADSDFQTLQLTTDLPSPPVPLASWVLLAISPVFGGPVRFLPHANPNDGLLDALVMRDRVRLYSVLRMLVLGLIHQTRLSSKVDFVTSTHVRLDAHEPDGRPVPYQVDGDFAGYLPIEVEMLPGALTLVAPR